jgi:hypothetical protein
MATYFVARLPARYFKGRGELAGHFISRFPEENWTNKLCNIVLLMVEKRLIERDGAAYRDEDRVENRPTAVDKRAG